MSSALVCDCPSFVLVLMSKSQKSIIKNDFLKFQMIQYNVQALRDIIATVISGLI